MTITFGTLRVRTREKLYDIFFLSFHVKVAIHISLELSLFQPSQVSLPFLIRFYSLVCIENGQKSRTPDGGRQNGPPFSLKR